MSLNDDSKDQEKMAIESLLVLKHSKDSKIAIDKSSITIFDEWNEDYKLFSDCSKLDYIINNSQLLGSGGYETVYKYCRDNNCKIGYAVKKITTVHGDLYNPDNPLWSSVRIGYLLNLFVLSNTTPHIILTFGNFQCNIEGNNIFVVITSLADGDLSSIINTLSELELTVIIFQIIYTIAAIQTMYPNFKHNDLSMFNVFYKKTDLSEKYYEYIIGDMIFTIPNVGYRILIADFDLSIINGLIENMNVPNGKDEYNITDAYNPYYDVGYLLYHMYSSITDERLRKILIPILQFIPDGINPNNYRPLSNVIFTIPYLMLKFDLFKPFQGHKYKNIVVYDATKPIPALESSEFINTFLSCPANVFLANKKSQSASDAIYLKLCKNPEIKLPDLDLEYVKQQYDILFKNKRIFNPYADVPITINILIELTFYIWKYIQANFVIYANIPEYILMAIKEKLYIHFSVFPKTILFKMIHTQIYRAIPMTVEIVDEFFRLRSLK